VPERECLRVARNGVVFRFYYDPDGELHVVNAHGTTIDEALDTFFSGGRSEDTAHLRFVSDTESHILLWAWYAKRVDEEVVVISCDRKEASDAEIPRL